MAVIARKNIPPSRRNTGKTKKEPPDRPGLLRPGELSVTDRTPLATAWVSDELLARTIDVWTRAYDRPVAAPEAMEILTNVKRFGEFLARAIKEGNV